MILGIVINALLARLLSPAEFGGYLTCFTIVIVGGLIAQLGLDRAVVRLVSASIGIGDPGQARHAIERVLAIGAIGSLAVGAVVGVAGPWMGRHVYHSEIVADVSLFTGGWLVASAMQSLLVETFRGLQRFDLATLLDAVLLDVLWATAFAGLLLVGADVGLAAVIGISAFTTALIACLAGLLLVGRVRVLRGEGRVPPGGVFDIAWPSLVTNVASYFLSTGIDLLVLGAFRPQPEVALYGAATRLVVLVATPLWILRGVLPPLIAELHAQGRKVELERTLRTGATLAGLPSLLILLVFVFFGRPVMGILYGSFYREGALVLVLLSIGRLVSVWAGSSGVTLIMSGHQKAMMALTVVTGALSVAGGILLAPRFGGPGVAIATTSMAVVQNLMQVALAKRLVGVWTHIDLSARDLRAFLTGRPRDG
jgi:O-antigen/teichoic acid export membrane protein